LTSEVSRGFDDVGPGLHFPIGREASRILIIKNVKTGELVHRDALVKDGVRLATENFYRVAKVDKCFGEVARVDALATDMRFSPIREVRNPQGAVWVVSA
jgi:hypothetical protein